MFGSNPFSASSFSQSPTGSVGVTGVAATGGVGSVTINGNVEVSATGLGATGAVGALVFTESVAVTGLQATGSVGSASVSVLANVSVTGVSAFMPTTSTETGSSLFGGLSFSEEPFATLGDGDLLITFQLGVGDSVTGIAATGSVGSVEVNSNASASVTGVSATASVGSVIIDGDAIVAVTGIAGTGGAGSVTVTEGTGPIIALGSLSAQGQVGIVVGEGSLTVPVTGVSATASTSGASVVAWNEINPNQDPNWTEIAA